MYKKKTQNQFYSKMIVNNRWIMIKKIIQSIIYYIIRSALQFNYYKTILFFFFFIYINLFCFIIDIISSFERIPRRCVWIFKRANPIILNNKYFFPQKRIDDIFILCRFIYHMLYKNTYLWNILSKSIQNLISDSI